MGDEVHGPVQRDTRISGKRSNTCSPPEVRRLPQGRQPLYVTGSEGVNPSKVDRGVPFRGA